MFEREIHTHTETNKIIIVPRVVAKAIFKFSITMGGVYYNYIYIYVYINIKRKILLRSYYTIKKYAETRKKKEEKFKDFIIIIDIWMIQKLEICMEIVKMVIEFVEICVDAIVSKDNYSSSSSTQPNILPTPYVGF